MYRKQRNFDPATQVKFAQGLPERRRSRQPVGNAPNASCARIRLAISSALRGLSEAPRLLRPRLVAGGVKIKVIRRPKHFSAIKLSIVMIFASTRRAARKTETDSRRTFSAQFNLSRFCPERTQFGHQYNITVPIRGVVISAQKFLFDQCMAQIHFSLYRNRCHTAFHRGKLLRPRPHLLAQAFDMAYPDGTIVHTYTWSSVRNIASAGRAISRNQDVGPKAA